MIKKISSLSILITIIVLCLENSFAQSNWYHITSPGNVRTIFFIDSLKGWVGGDDGIFNSIDGGTTWTNQMLPVKDQISRIKFVSPNIGFAVGFNGSIFKTTNAGITWLLKRSGVALYSIFFIDNQNGWACGRDTVLKTTNQGETWVAHSAQSAIGLWDVSFRNSTEGWAVGLYNGCYKSTDAGDSWNAVDPPISGRSQFGVCFPSSSRGIEIAGEQIALSTDSGNSWKSVYNSGGIQLNSVSFADSLNGWVAGTDKIVRTTNGGSTWHVQSLPTPYGYLTSVYSFDKNNVWAVGDKNILKTIDGGEITSVSSFDKINPNFTYLYQNYPNPFNPSTTITYSIPKSSFVTLEIFDILGRNIKTIVNENKPAGNYSVHFNASKLTSGIYFYRLQAGNFIETKKLLLLK